MILWWAILFLVAAIGLLVTAISKIAMILPLGTQVILFVAMICFLVSLILIIIEKLQPGKN